MHTEANTSFIIFFSARHCIILKITALGRGNYMGRDQKMEQAIPTWGTAVAPYIWGQAYQEADGWGDGSELFLGLSPRSLEAVGRILTYFCM